MTRDTWNEVDLSAYLDGQLREERRDALEAEMARDAALREQVEALRQRVQQDDLLLEPEFCFLDDGYTGATLIRPALSGGLTTSVTWRWSSMSSSSMNSCLWFFVLYIQYSKIR